MILFLCASSWSFAQNEQERGAQILDIQLQQARHLKELEYQAEVLERQARIAKAQQQIDKTIGLESLGDLRTFAGAEPNKDSSPLPLPHIVELTDSLVTLQFSNGDIGVFAVGDELPTGHTLMSISMIDGVILVNGSSQSQLNFSW